MTRLFVTGATGFVGPYVVAAAVARGHHVTALVRPGTEPTALRAALDTERLDIVRGDLSRPGPLAEAMTGVDVILHLAVVKGGDYFSRFSGTVVGTETLLQAARAAGVTHLAAVSTFSVYDYSGLARNAVIDESTPVITDVSTRDEYAETKLYQDELYTAFGAEPGHRIVMLRPGMIYGRGELWHPLLGGELGPLPVRVGRSARPPITYVENTAEALILGAELLVSEPGRLDGRIVNIVDDDLVTQQDYVERLRARARNHPELDLPRAPTVPFGVMRAAASTVQWVNGRFFDGRAKVPALAVPDQVDARFKAFTYPNARAKSLLGWTPRYGLDQALDRSLSGRDLVAELAGRSPVAGSGVAS